MNWITNNIFKLIPLFLYNADVVSNAIGIYANVPDPDYNQDLSEGITCLPAWGKGRLQMCNRY